jgi:hypothetical protein
MDAELIRPERWDEDMPMHHNKTNAAWGSLSFDGDPRISIGRGLQLNVRDRGKFTD